MWEINSASCRKHEAKLIATKTNVDELAGGNKYLVVDNCELFYSKRKLKNPVLRKGKLLIRQSSGSS